jgi:hypothetical protein
MHENDQNYQKEKFYSKNINFKKKITTLMAVSFFPYNIFIWRKEKGFVMQSTQLVKK